MAVELLSVHVDLVPRRCGVQQLHVLAGLNAVEVELKGNHHVTAGVGLSYPMRAGHVRIWTRFGRGADPLRLPVVWRKDASHPRGGRAPVGCRVRAVPRAHFPPVTARRCKLLPAIHHVNRVRARHLSRVPHVTRIRSEFLLRACHYDVVCALGCVFPRRNLPA